VANKAFVLDAEGSQLSQDIADNMFNLIIDKDKLFKAWDDVRESDVYNGWISKVRSAGYAASHSLEAEEDDRILRFMGKGNFKAKEDPLTFAATAKAPQGILAWSKGANSFFGYACRMVTDVVRNSLKANVVWNNGVTVEQAARQFTAAALKVPVDENVRIDAVEMDSKQNEFTHSIVKAFIAKLYVDSDFLDLYFSMMADYKVSNPEIKMFLQWVKASGEPWTLFGNSFLMTALTLWLIRGEGPFALFSQGDDVDLNQANMRVDEDRLRNIQLYSNFDMTLEWGRYAAFCGYVLASGQLVPNIRRKLIKLMGCTFVNQLHFEQVQISIRLWMLQLRSGLGFYDAIRVNAETYQVSIAQVESWLEAIDSLGHISAAQFAAASNPIAENVFFMSQSYSGKYDVLNSVY